MLAPSEAAADVPAALELRDVVFEAGDLRLVDADLLVELVDGLLELVELAEHARNLCLL